MKKILKAPNYAIALFSIFLVTLSCDTEYSSIESSVLGEGNFNFNGNAFEIPVKAYNKNLSAQQINGLTSNLLGFFDDPIYGETTASIVTQVVPSSFATNDANMFGVNPIIESVTLTIPYFSTQTSIDTEGKPEYKIDSLFVKNNNPENIKPIRLKIYENSYFLRSFNPVDIENNSQNYFSKADASINNTDNFSEIESGSINFDEHIGQLFYDDSYTIEADAREIKSTTGGIETTSYLPPALELELADSDTSKARWQSLILDQAGLPTLSNANNFLNHFRGLYIKAQAENGDGSMVLLNLADSGASITINYSSDDGADADTDRDSGSYTLNLNGNRLNTFINNYNPAILPTTPNTDEGDETLYIKGSEGSMSVIELFNGMGDCGEDALECFKRLFRKTNENGEFIQVNEQFELKRLINEAHLVIYEDDTFITPEDPKDLNGEDYHRYDRLYIYDLENNIPILDYNTDITTDASNPLVSRTFSLGRRITDENGVSKYKLKVTDLLNNILIRDVNVTKLGLVLTNNVNINSNTALLNSTDNVTGIPSTAIITPRGTVLHGSNTTATTNEGISKKLRLEVFFTELN
ncbi:DUF4270 domain-containing protein [Hyunsoonleella pacifica]|uniref:DUF4270 domain-containing protein n=1 Tax=Hyunsoonleella pacifica TaxID=1080224 RepID=A0A4Q9FP18_9FLAO|nr:DUF4270 domain-containing protein [Hyunsoonleella pacifica]TBN16398.1 DUF4270 domain-containing protein [Hyunsoonleella pacifica]GGD19760.1 hypothetical protein GCM10011368_22100 [Hyunsoonleella pacifica]